jgi:A/G-specific adenine glycosylase
MNSTEPDSARVSRIRAHLLDHYGRAQRDLPWRRRSDPYGIWVSEVMLQQTRVETVIPYYLRWMERFPDVESLAEANLDEVLLLWKGLGYYGRARNLHRAAGVVRERFAGRLPSDPQELRGLPGIGEYTAGALGSIAFGRAEPAVDGNVRRVLSRLFDLEEPGPSRVRSLASALVDPERPGDFNQALMELGATVCLPGRPDCGACPVSSDCMALEAGTVGLRPPPTSRKTVPVITVATAVVYDEVGDRFLVRKRPTEGLLASMWEFPGAEVEGDVPVGVELALQSLPAGLSLPVDVPELARALVEVRHAFTHLRAIYRGFLVPVAEAEPAAEFEVVDDPEPRRRWASCEELSQMALPRAQERLLQVALEAIRSAS